MEVAVYCGTTQSWSDKVCRAAKERGSFNVLSPSDVLGWVESHGEGSVLIFGTDVMPYSLFDYPERPRDETAIFKFMERGGAVIWAGDVPFYYVEKDGKKIDVFSKANPFPFTPLNLEHRPVAEKGEDTIVGEMLGYDPKDSWRPVPKVRGLVPISRVTVGSKVSYSAWIYRHGKGMFVRVYDSPYVDENYVLSLPEKLKELNKIGVRVRGLGRLKDYRMVLPKLKVGVIMGDNNVGKTSLLEAIALLDERNRELVEKFRDKKEIKGEVELYLNGEYYYKRLSDTKTNYKGFLLIYSHLFEQVEVDPQTLRGVTELMERFDPKVFYVYLSANKKVRVLFSDKTDVSIHELGYGYKSLLYFLIMLAKYRPKVVLIDDLEGFSLHPELLNRFYEFLLGLDVELVLITTQSSDVYAYLAYKAKVKERDDVFFILMNDEKYEVLTTEDALDIMDYEDLRYFALRVGKDEARGKTVRG